jgi:hypothetical protein
MVSGHKPSDNGAMNLRRLLLRGLPMGWLAMVSGTVWAAGQPPQPSGFKQIRGDVRVNGQPAHAGRVVLPGDVVTTGPGSEAIYVMGHDAYLVRENSEIGHLAQGAQAVLRVITGKVLSVFGPGARTLQTATATAGIRGTACYIDSAPDLVYFCLCYGKVELTPLADPARAFTFQTRYHDRPFYIGNQANEELLRPGPVIDHTDAELVLLESLVGRRPPFTNPLRRGGGGGGY